MLYYSLGVSHALPYKYQEPVENAFEVWAIWKGVCVCVCVCVCVKVFVCEKVFV